ncbi:MAG: hypothetical protein KH828_00885 [Clostridiales bacterium]|nr:hypothetical protein [Clostridiales bacterium]
MSYCVNCGVELDKTCSVCPLCNTKVFNPNQPVDTLSPGPYPSRRGKTDPVRRSDITILMSVVLATTAVVCGLLNLLLFTGTYWSLYVIGICVVFWVFFLPVFFPAKFPSHLCLFLDGVSIAMYFGIIAFLHPGNGWYFFIALPLIVLCTVLVVLYASCLRSPRRSFLALAAVLVGELGILNVSIELLVRFYLYGKLTLSWSAIVLTCCIIIDVALVTILRTSRLREEIRRRMHI